MKLKDWADRQGISYLTAWRWFKAGDPRLANAYQSNSGTIIVPDELDTSESQILGNTSNDVMLIVLKKTVEFSKNNASIEDFAAWILSNYSLKPHSQHDGPKYSRILKSKGEKSKNNMFVASPEAIDDLVAKSDDLTAQELVEQVEKVGVKVGAPISSPEVDDLMKDLTSAIHITPSVGLANVTTYDNIAEGVVARSVDLIPQQLNGTAMNSSYVQPASVSMVSPRTEIAPHKTKRGRKSSKGKK